MTTTPTAAVRPASPAYPQHVSPPPAEASSSHSRPAANSKALLSFLPPQVASYFIAGGVAGAASRTVVSPLERLKIIQQIQSPTSDKQYKGVWRSLIRMWHEEGLRGFMRGNGVNCLRIVPYSAVQFTTYETLKKFFVNYRQAELDTPTRLLSGALAGITSVSVTYPLDLVRSRLSIASASLDLEARATATAARSGTGPSLAANYHSSAPGRNAVPGIWGMTLKVIREEGGIRALYRGLVPTATGVAPYVGINFAAYELLRSYITPPGKTSVARKLSCGALAGSISQTLTYPLDVLRRKMQVTGMGSLGPQYNGALHALRVILRTQGIPGLYVGLWPNLLKVAPSIATSFFSYELVKEFLGAS